MNREADHTIKGFVYQFNKTLEELLKSEDGTNITVEGIVEDIDIISSDTIKAIQCKYHETKENFKISDISKPILQMLSHFANNKDKNIQYILYAHFPNENEGDKVLTKSDIETIISTKNQKYIVNYISKIKPPEDDKIKELVAKEKRSADDLKKIKNYYLSNPDLPLITDLNEFLNPEKFKFIIGKSFQNLVEDTKKLFEMNSSFSKEDIEEIFYPNAIQIIADKSIEPDAEKRIIEKRYFLNKLEKTKKVAISRWTKELLSYHKLLKKRRSQLSENLKQNHRLRYFIFDSSSIEKFDDKIVSFIVDYLNKYHFKIKLHSKTPIFCIQTENSKLLFDIQKRLFTKGISVTTGYVGDTFFEQDFLREPKKIIKDSWFEFRLRLCLLNDKIIGIINKKKCDDLFLIGNIITKKINILDINIEKIEVSNLKELKYLLSLSNDIG